MDIGRTRRRKARSAKARERGPWEFFIDFSPHLRGGDRFLTSDRGVTFESEEHAEAIRRRIGALLDQRIPIDEAVNRYRRPKDKRHQVVALAKLWADGLPSSSYDYSPYTLAQYRRMSETHFRWWGTATVHEVTWERLEEWTQAMRAKGLSVKRAKNILTAFRAFLRWVRQRDKSFVIPEFPRLRTVRRRPETMPIADQVAALRALPDEHRGIFLALALTIRPGEARALTVRDYDFKRREVHIAHALKGAGPRAARGPTKTGETGRYPVGRELTEWIERNVPTEARFKPDTPLFPNPRTGKPYCHLSLARTWRNACDDAEVPYVPIYRALKHSTLSELARELPLEVLQGLARHRSVETTRGYLGEVADPKALAVEARERLVAEHSTTTVRTRDLQQPANRKKPEALRRN